MNVKSPFFTSLLLLHCKWLTLRDDDVPSNVCKEKMREHRDAEELISLGKYIFPRTSQSCIRGREKRQKADENGPTRKKEETE